MKTALCIFATLCMFAMCVQAFPRYHHKGFRPHVVPVPYHPGYPIARGPSLGDGLTLLTSAALLGTGNPGFQTLGGLGLISLG
ncbi:hypothetical protein ACF0H5_009712 [Mactra antiquata]